MCPYTAILIFLLIVLIVSCCDFQFPKRHHSKKPGDDTTRVYYFYRDGCGWCDKFNPEFNTFAQQTSLIVEKIDTTDSKNHKLLNLANNVWGMEGTPFVVFVNNAKKEYTVYKGPRTAQALLDYSTSFVPTPVVQSVPHTKIQDPLFTPDHEVLSS